MFAVLVDASLGWCGVRITPTLAQQLDSLKTNGKGKRAAQLAA